MIAWIAALVASLGYGGVFLLMVAENLILVLPSEVIMPLAGFAAGRGQLTLVGVILVGVVGSTLGSLPWYKAGERIGLARTRALVARYGMWFTLETSHLNRLVLWFGRWGGFAVLLGRLVPGVRTLGSLTAGIVRLPLGLYLLYTTLGAALWVGGLTLAGYALGTNYALVAEWLEPAGKLALVLLVLGYGYRLARRVMIRVASRNR
jgi:membrane protein DedA with SNARE-associated domain